MGTAGFHMDANDEEVEAHVQRALAVATVCQAASRPLALSAIGLAINEYTAQAPGQATWFTNALRQLKIRYSVSDKWGSSELRQTAQVATALGLVTMTNGQFHCTLAGNRRLRASAPPSTAETEALRQATASLMKVSGR
jgi:hypothetical protein